MIELNDYKNLSKISNKPDYEIYRGFRSIDDAPVVLKYLTNANEYSRLKKECEVIHSFNDDSIIKTYGLFPYSNGYILILEDGGISLREYIKQNRNLEIKEFLKIAIELTKILALVHRNKVIHKDIKPSNFVLKKDDENLKIKIID